MLNFFTKLTLLRLQNWLPQKHFVKFADFADFIEKYHLIYRNVFLRQTCFRHCEGEGDASRAERTGA